MSAALMFPALAAVSLAVSAAAVPLVRLLARRTGLLDDPGAGTYKTHTSVTPYGGGIAILLGVALPAIAALGWIVEVRPFLVSEGGRLLSPWSPQTLFPLEPLSPTILQLGQATSLLLAMLVVFGLGLADDWRRLPAGLRLLVQAGTALALILGVPGFAPVFSGSAWLDAILALLWLVAMTNAFNFLDNMNGLSAGIGVISITALTSMALAGGHLPAAALGLLVVGATGGFLLYNFPRASIFMGDAGGFLLGLAAGGLALQVCARLQDLAGPVAPQWWWLPLGCLVVPAYDLTTVVLLRLRHGQPPWQGDTRHISHRLVALGLDRTDAVLVIYLITAATTGLCVAAFHLPESRSWLLVLFLLALAALAGLDARTTPRPDS